LASGSVTEIAVALDATRFGVGPDRGSTSVSAGREVGHASGTFPVALN